MKGRCFCEPDMTINAGSFIEPAFFHGRIHPYRRDIIPAVIQVIGDIVLKTAVAAVFFADVKSVDPEHRIAMDAVKLDDYAPAQIGFRNKKFFPIPSHTVFRKSSSDFFIAMTMTTFAVERQFDCPVMRQVDHPPGAVVKIEGRRAVSITGFCIKRKISRSMIKIFFRVKRMAQGKSPAKIHQIMFPAFCCFSGIYFLIENVYR